MTKEYHLQSNYVSNDQNVGNVSMLQMTCNNKYTDKGEFIRCPCCGEKTRTKIRDDTILIRHLLYCPKCKAELLVNIRKKSITILERLDAKAQGQ